MREPDSALRALMIASLEGDAGAYRALLTDLRLRLADYFGRRLGPDTDDVEALVRETLIAIHRSRGTYDPRHALIPWLHAIARYKLVDHDRRRRP